MKGQRGTDELSTGPTRSTKPSNAEESSDVRPGRAGLGQWLSALELLFFYACVLLYIWRWQHTHPRTWIGLVLALMLTHIFHRDDWRSLGLTLHNLRANATSVLPIMLALYALLLTAGFASGRLRLLAPGAVSLRYFLGYGVWCVCQQYLTQSYFHNRLMAVISNRNLSSLLVALMFGAAHLPNPVLTVVTTVAGFIFSEVFARHRNIWPLALVQTVGGILIAAVTPASLIHNMRVGPGYWNWNLG